MRIELKQVGQRYTNQWLYRHVDEVIEPGERILVRGANGSGKSTFIKTLCGYIEPTEGDVIWTSGAQKLSVDEVYAQYSVSSPMAEMWGDLKGIELLHIVSELKPLIMTVDEVLDRLLLKKDAKKPVKFYSSGMKQRLMTGLALLMKSEIVFLDEPAVNLDVNGLEWFHQLLNDVIGNRTLVFSSNNPEEFKGIDFNRTVQVDGFGR